MFSIICCRRKEFQSRTVWVGQECLQKFPPNIIKNTKYNIITFLPLVSYMLYLIRNYQNKIVQQHHIYLFFLLGIVEPIQILFKCIFLNIGSNTVLSASSSWLLIHLLVTSSICDRSWTYTRSRRRRNKVCDIC